MARFLAPRWLIRHALMLSLVTAFLALGWWQVGRARTGNTLSYAYAFEWPLFAAFVVFVWVKEVRTELRRSSGEAHLEPDRPANVPDELTRQPGYVPFSAVPPRRRQGGDDGDQELVAYNRYLEWLAANPGRRSTEYPG